MDYSWYISPQEYKQAKKNGICRSTLEDRIRQRGWSKRKATNKPVRGHETWSKELIEALKKNNISFGTFASRIYALGWNRKKAATTPAKHKYHKPKDDAQEEFNKYSQLAQENGIHANTFKSRIHLGWSMKEASTTPTRNRKIAQGGV